MADQNQDNHANAQDVPDAPGPGVVTADHRKKRSKKGVLIGLTLVSVMGLTVWNVFLGGSEEEDLTLDGKSVSRGTADIDAKVDDGGMGGGMRQEVAANQANIEEEERRQERLQNGRSVISLGETILNEDEGVASSFADEEPPAEANQTFGSISEPAAPAPATTGPIEFAGQPGRERITRSGSRAGSGTGGMSVAIQNEMANLQEADQVASEGWHAEVSYAGSSSVQQADNADLLSSPGSNTQDGRMEEPTLEPGSLGMPGDTLVAYMENRITSEQPSARVVATIMSGPLKGGKAIGQASFEGDRLLINFSRVVTKDRTLFDNLEMLAVDPKTYETSLQSGIDRRLFQRYGVPVLYGIAALGIDYAAVKDSTVVTETDASTGEVTTRSVQTDPSFGEYALDSGSDTLKQPLSNAAERAADTEPLAWANPGIIGLMLDSPIPAKQ